MEEEARFAESLKQYIREHGVDNFYEAVAPVSKKSLVPKTVKLPKIKEVNLEEFEEDVKKSVKKYHKLYLKFKNIPKVEFLIHRYDVLGYLNNISLSVHPDIKKRWGINHELFGAFYNVNLENTYCSLFPDLEPNSLGNVFFFKPKKGMKILVNPPYTKDFIEWTIRKILDSWINKAEFYIVIPVWDSKSRDMLGLKRYPDFPAITELLEKAKHSEISKEFPFYNGIESKKVLLKDPVHVIKI